MITGLWSSAVLGEDDLAAVMEERREKLPEFRLLDGINDCNLCIRLGYVFDDLWVRYCQIVILGGCMRLDRDEISPPLLRGAGRVADRSFVIPAFAMMGALAWQVNESQWKKHSFSGVFEGRSHGDLPGISSLCVLLLFLRSLSLLALRYLFRSHRSLHPFKLGSEGDTQRFVNICLISDDAEKGMRQGFKGWAEILIFSNMPTVTWAQSRRSTIFVF